MEYANCIYCGDSPCTCSPEFDEDYTKDITFEEDDDPEEGEEE
jgi:hypothetical protein